VAFADAASSQIAAIVDLAPVAVDRATGEACALPEPVTRALDRLHHDAGASS